MKTKIKTKAKQVETISEPQEVFLTEGAPLFISKSKKDKKNAHQIRKHIVRLDWLNSQGADIVTYYEKGGVTVDMDVYKIDKTGKHLGYIKGCEQVVKLNN